MVANGIAEGESVEHVLPVCAGEHECSSMNQLPAHVGLVIGIPGEGGRVRWRGGERRGEGEGRGGRGREEGEREGGGGKGRGGEGGEGGRERAGRGGEGGRAKGKGEMEEGREGKGVSEGERGGSKGGEYMYMYTYHIHVRTCTHLYPFRSQKCAFLRTF